MKEQTKVKRSYDNSLRRQQQEVTLEAIRTASFALIREGRIHNFTIQEVAERAGVSYGSVYRHYPSREILLKGILDWGMEYSYQMQPSYPDSLDDLPSWVEQTVPSFIEFLPLVQPLHLLRTALQGTHSRASERDELVIHLIKQAAPEVPKEYRKAAFSIIRLLISVNTWAEMYVRFELDEKALILATSEGIKAQIQHLKAKL